jgi:hypothetical protein
MNGKTFMFPASNRNLRSLSMIMILFVSGACSLSSTIFRASGSPADSVEIVETQMAGGGDADGCYTTGDEFDEYWTSYMYSSLSSVGKTCDIGAVNDYQYCLRGKILGEGMCKEEAEMACKGEYAAIEPVFEENIRISLDPTHSEAEDETGYMDVDNGNVSGLITYTMKDKHLCTINVKANFAGDFLTDGCTMSGKASLEILYDGTACASICGSGPDSQTPCPVTQTGETTWQATVTRDYDANIWVIQGGVGCGDNDPGCVGFQGGY